MPRTDLLSEGLPGTWELISRIDQMEDGTHRAEPSLGANPLALLFYDRSGHFAAQFMKRDRSSPEVDQASSGGANNSRAIGGYDAYFGTYDVDDGTRVVTQRLAGALSAENVGLVVERSMTVEGDRLTIVLDTAVDGEAIKRTLTWKRVG